MRPDTSLHQSEVWNVIGGGGQTTAHNLGTRQRIRAELAEAHLAHLLGDSAEARPRFRRPRLLTRFHLMVWERLTLVRSRPV